MSEVITDKLTGKTSAGDVTITSEGGAVTMQLQQGLAKAWGSIDQDSTGHPVYDSFNVTSTADSSTGETTVTYINVMSNNNYSLSGTAQSENENASNFSVIGKDSTFPNATTNFRSDNRNSSGSNQDVKYFSFALHGDLA